MCVEGSGDLSMSVEVSVRSRGSLPRLMPHHSTDGTSPLHLLQNFISRPHTGRTCPRDAHDLQNRIGIAPSIDPQHHLIAKHGVPGVATTGRKHRSPLARCPQSVSVAWLRRRIIISSLSQRVLAHISLRLGPTMRYDMWTLLRSRPRKPSQTLIPAFRVFRLPPTRAS